MRLVVTNVLVNRVAVDKPLTLQSVNGPQFTVIRGYQIPGTTNGDGAVRCVYLTNGASLSGFTLTNGATQTNGDWFCNVIGGGVLSDSTNAQVMKCVIVSNSACGSGGGASGGTFSGCTLTANSATGPGGGAGGSMLNNCIVCSNEAPLGTNYSGVSTLDHGCTTPMPTNGLGNITNALSALRVLSVAPTSTNINIAWQSVAGVDYFRERSTNLAARLPFSLVATNLAGQPGATSFTDTNAASLSPLFYRVGVGN